MKTQAQRKRAQDRAYKLAREQRIVRARGICERCDKAEATQTHHVQRRSHGVDHDIENLRALCLDCHQWLHLNVEDAKSSGWISTRWPQL